MSGMNGDNLTTCTFCISRSHRNRSISRSHRIDRIRRILLQQRIGKPAETDATNKRFSSILFVNRTFRSNTTRRRTAPPVRPSSSLLLFTVNTELQTKIKKRSREHRSRFGVLSPNVQHEDGGDEKETDHQHRDRSSETKWTIRLALTNATNGLKQECATRGPGQKWAENWNLWPAEGSRF